MDKAVRSVECYLLPSCVLVNGTFKEKKLNFILFSLFLFNFKQKYVNFDKFLYFQTSLKRKQELVGALEKEWFTSNLRM